MQDSSNFLFILADNLGWNDLNCMVSKYYETSNLDRIGANCILFTKAYATCQVFSSSLVSIMIGKNLY